MAGEWAKKTVVVSGGSKGLGAQIAIRAARQNARVIILGRDQASLDQVRQKAIEAGAHSVEAVSVDAGKIHESEAYLQAIAQSGIDLLINAIGRSDRGTLEQLSIDDLQSMVRDNVFLGWNVTKTSLPSLEKSQGVIVNIGSLAGLIATPQLGAYSTSKFALTAMSRQWRLELQPRGIHVLLVCPGPIARDDSDNRYGDVISQREGLSDAARRPAGGAKLNLLDPVWLSDKILSEASRRKPELIVPAKAKILAALMPFFPSWADRILLGNLRR